MLSPVLVHCRERTRPVAGGFVQYLYEGLETADQIGHCLFCHADRFPVPLQQPSHILMFAAYLVCRLACMIPVCWWGGVRTLDGLSSTLKNSRATKSNHMNPSNTFIAFVASQ